MPAVVDLAAMRSAMKRLGGDPKRINPLIPVDLVIDHSVQVDRFGTPDALAENVELEFQRNRERYEFLRWGQKAFGNFRVVPPAVGIVHQVNLEYLAKCVFLREDAAGPVALPDTLVGTDSHTTMINGLGVVGWGVGGIEAEAVMLGQPLYMLAPEVVGFELTGQLPPGATATDLVLTVTQILRTEGVVDKFVEFFGPGAGEHEGGRPGTVANMAPEYGATMGFFPVDEQTLAYLRETGRTDDGGGTGRALHARSSSLFRDRRAAADAAATPRCCRSTWARSSRAWPGPKRPQDRVPLGDVKQSFRQALRAPAEAARLRAVRASKSRRRPRSATAHGTIGHGAVVIAAITSCTNTSNPERDAGRRPAGQEGGRAGLDGQAVREDQPRARQPRGDRLLRQAGLDKPLEQLGFHTVGYGCTTCIGNSGPLPEPVAKARRRRQPGGGGGAERQPQLRGPHQSAGQGQLPGQPAAGGGLRPGRHGRHRPDHRAAGHRRRRPAGVPQRHLAQPGGNRRGGCRRRSGPRCSASATPTSSRPTRRGTRIPVAGGELYPLGSEEHVHPGAAVPARTWPPSRGRSEPIRGARVLAALGDSVTTDHISPAGSIAASSPAGKYLQEQGVAAGRLQQLRLAARQRSGDDAGHVRQHPHPQPAGPRHRRRRDAAPARRPADDRSTTRP